MNRKAVRLEVTPAEMRYLRETEGLTNKQIAERLDCAPATVSLTIWIPRSESTTKARFPSRTVFVHGKVHRRQYLLDHHIRWNPALTVHEDSYFNTLCQKIADPSRVKYCPTPFYLWKWRDASVCRHDPKYILKTYPSMLESSAALVREFLSRGRAKDAQMIAVGMIFDSYFTMNKKDWIDQENLSYRLSTEERFAKYYLEFRRLFDTAPEAEKLQIVSCIRKRMYMEGLLMESITFDQWTSIPRCSPLWWIK